jgi:hypothetical protein
MIRHIVLVRFAKDVEKSAIQSLFDRLADLRHQLPGMKNFKAGTSVSPEGLEQGFDHGISIDFDDIDARDAYLDLPDHKALGGELVSMAEGGIKGLIVFDLKL